MKRRWCVFAAALWLASACGDEEEQQSNPNNIAILDAGGDDSGSDAGTLDASDMADLGENDQILVQVSPSTLDLKLAEIQRLTATVSVNGTPVEAAEITWASNADNIATVDQEGTVTGVAAGAALITATYGEVSGRVSLRVYAIHNDVAAGGAHTCAAKADGRVTCWGDNTHMQAGGGDKVNSTTPIEINLPDGEFADTVYAGETHSCAILRSGKVGCWGDNSKGQLDPQANVPERAEPLLLDFGTTVEKLALGANFSCALLDTGAVRCWGDNTSKIVDATANTVAGPSNAQPALSFRDVAAGRAHVCGVTQMFDVYCWGDHTNGQLGDNGVSGHAAIKVGTTQYISVFASGDQTCGYSLFQGLQCWGSSAGGFGDAATTRTTVPTTLALAEGEFKGAALGRANGCAVVDATTYCWGKNDKGQLGDNTVADHAAPAAVLGEPFYPTLSCGAEHCCALSEAGDAFCWGAGAEGQLGNGELGPRRVPTYVEPTAF